MTGATDDSKRPTIKKPNFGSPVIDILNKESELKNKEIKNFGIVSCGSKKTTEITLNLKTAKIFLSMFNNLYSVNWKTRENLKQTLADHIEACSK